MTRPPPSAPTSERLVLDAELLPPREPDGQLVFEPGTGRLVLRLDDDRAADAVPATEMVRSGFFADKDPNGTAAVLRRLENIGDEADDDLVFDPTTGRLTVRRKGEAAPSPDAVSAVQMARTGFFAGPAFGDVARAQQAHFRATSATIGATGRAPTDDKGVRHGHLLALGHEQDNLFPTLRGDGGAMRFLAERQIKWWRSARSGDASGNGPTRNLASSQVACVNFLLPLAGVPGALATAMRALDPEVEEVVDIVHGPHASPVELEWVGWRGPLEGGATTRGANQTSADALVLTRTAKGLRAWILEWKYCEAYPVEDKGAGPSGETRRRRYTASYEAPDSAFVPGVPLDAWLFEPFYQLLRLQLLGDRMLREGVTATQRVDDVRVAVVCPRANVAFREGVTSPELRRRHPTLRTVEDVVRANLKDPRRFTVVGQEDLVAALRASPVAEALVPWLAYHRERYGT